MKSFIRMLVTTVMTASVAGVTLPPPAVADDSAAPERNGSTAVQTLGLASPLKPVTRTFHGVIASVDEGKDTIKIRRSSADTEDLKVQDGLLFNAVRYGDEVEVTVEDINGATTIVGLMKQ